MISITARLSRLALPPLCVACGAPAGAGTLPVTASDWTGKRSVTLSFPLCPECERVTAIAHTPLGGMRRGKVAKADAGAVERFDLIRHAVKVHGYKPTAFRSATADSVTFEFGNRAFAELFSFLNGGPPPTATVAAEPVAEPETVPARPDR
jgi:hypothetical protein